MESSLRTRPSSMSPGDVRAVRALAVCLTATLLEESIRKYQNRAIEAAAVIQELIVLAK